MQDIHRKNAKKLTVNPPDMSNKSNLEDFPLILYEAANDECKFLCKLICMQIMDPGLFFADTVDNNFEY